MAELSPKVEAIRLLRNDMWEHLENAEYLAQPYSTWKPEDQEQAEAVIEQLVTVIRGVLILHEGDTDDEPENRCRTCASPWPCPTLTSAHGLIRDPDGELSRLLTKARGFS